MVNGCRAIKGHDGDGQRSNDDSNLHVGQYDRISYIVGFVEFVICQEEKGSQQWEMGREIILIWAMGWLSLYPWRPQQAKLSTETWGIPGRGAPEQIRDVLVGYFQHGGPN